MEDDILNELEDEDIEPVPGEEPEVGGGLDEELGEDAEIM